MSRRTPIGAKASLLVTDFKDRRDHRQRASYAAISSLRQAMLDRQLLEEFNRRVADNFCRRLARKIAISG